MARLLGQSFFCNHLAQEICPGSVSTKVVRRQLAPGGGGRVVRQVSPFFSMENGALFVPARGLIYSGTPRLIGGETSSGLVALSALHPQCMRTRSWTRQRGGRRCRRPPVAAPSPATATSTTATVLGRHSPQAAMRGGGGWWGDLPYSSLSSAHRAASALDGHSNWRGCWICVVASNPLDPVGSAPPRSSGMRPAPARAPASAFTAAVRRPFGVPIGPLGRGRLQLSFPSWHLFARLIFSPPVAPVAPLGH